MSGKGAQRATASLAAATNPKMSRLLLRARTDRLRGPDLVRRPCGSGCGVDDHQVSRQHTVSVLGQELEHLLLRKLSIHDQPGFHQLLQALCVAEGGVAGQLGFLPRHHAIDCHTYPVGKLDRGPEVGGPVATAPDQSQADRPGEGVAHPDGYDEHRSMFADPFARRVTGCTLAPMSAEPMRAVFITTLPACSLMAIFADRSPSGWPSGAVPNECPMAAVVTHEDRPMCRARRLRTSRRNRGQERRLVPRVRRRMLRGPDRDGAGAGEDVEVEAGVVGAETVSTLGLPRARLLDGVATPIGHHLEKPYFVRLEVALLDATRVR